MSPEHSTYLEAVSTTQALTYSISRRHDLSLVFEPPVGSRALANALSLKYPFEGGLENQMKRAMLDFINSEPSIAKSAPAISGKSNLMLSSEGGTDLAHPPAQSLLVAATSGAKSGSGVWDVKTGQPVEKKRKKSRYEEAKRRKVAEVRKKKACDYHRKKKTECNCSVDGLVTKLPSNRTPAKSNRPSSTSQTPLPAASSPTSQLARAPGGSFGPTMPGIYDPNSLYSSYHTIGEPRSSGTDSAFWDSSILQSQASDVAFSNEISINDWPLLYSEDQSWDESN